MPPASQQRRRHAVERVVFGQQRPKDIASAMGVKVQTVRQWLRQERDYIAECEQQRQRASAAAWAVRLSRFEP